MFQPQKKTVLSHPTLGKLESGYTFDKLQGSEYTNQVHGFVYITNYMKGQNKNPNSTVNKLSTSNN